MKILNANMTNVETGAPEMHVEIFYKTSETLPDGYAEGSIAYCYDGADKGKVKVYDGTQWVEQ